MGGWFSGLLSKVIPRGPNQMILPDDSKKSVIIIIIIIIKLFLLRVVLNNPRQCTHGPPFDCSRALEFAKIQTVLQSILKIG